MTAGVLRAEPEAAAAPGAAAPILPAPPSDQLRPAGPAGGGRLTWSAAWLLALLAHTAVLYALTREPTDLMPGGGGEQVEAISLTLVSSHVLESRDVPIVQPAPAPTASRVDESDGSSSKETAPEAKLKEEREEERDTEGEAKEKPKEEPIRAVEAVTELPQEEETPRKQQQSTAAVAGGNSIRTDIVTEQPSSQVRVPAAASPGAVRQYGRHVALALSKTKPKGFGIRATVQVTFTIAADGGLALAEVTKSSGYPKLDDAAIEAVRRTRFPVPPASMSTAQRFYQFPYHFR